LYPASELDDKDNPANVYEVHIANSILFKLYNN
jgi:hypothetical protein